MKLYFDRVKILFLTVMVFCCFNFAFGNNNNIVERVYFGFQTPGNLYRPVLLAFVDGATDGIDRGYDATVIDPRASDGFLFQDDQKFVILAFGEFDEDREIPVLVSIAEHHDGGLQKIMIDRLENFPDDRKILLRDKVLNVYHDLRQSVYEVNLASGEHRERFSIVFKEPIVEEDPVEIDPVEVEEPDEVYVPVLDPEEDTTDKTLHIEDIASVERGVVFYMDNLTSELQIINNSHYSISNILVFNSLGQKVDIKSLNTETTIINIPLYLNTGVYIVKMVTSEGNISKKIFVN